MKKLLVILGFVAGTAGLPLIASAADIGSVVQATKISSTSIKNTESYSGTYGSAYYQCNATMDRNGTFYLYSTKTGVVAHNPGMQTIGNPAFTANMESGIKLAFVAMQSESYPNGFNIGVSGPDGATVSITCGPTVIDCGNQNDPNSNPPCSAPASVRR